MIVFRISKREDKVGEIDIAGECKLSDVHRLIVDQSFKHQTFTRFNLKPIAQAL